MVRYKCLFKNEKLDCYDLLPANRPMLRLNLDSMVRLAQITMFLGVTVYYLLVFVFIYYFYFLFFYGRDCYETLTTTCWRECM